MAEIGESERDPVGEAEAAVLSTGREEEQGKEPATREGGSSVSFMAVTLRYDTRTPTQISRKPPSRILLASAAGTAAVDSMAEIGESERDPVGEAEAAVLSTGRE
jgi:hypothetical protein